MKTRLKTVHIISFCFLVNLCVAQVGIGTDNPHNSAILEISSDDKGVLIPKLPNNVILNMNNPAKGLLVYNDDFAKFQYFDGFQWLDIQASNGPSTPSLIQNVDGDVYVDTELGLAEKKITFTSAFQQVMVIDTNVANITPSVTLNDDPFDSAKARLDVDGRIKISDDNVASPEGGMIRWNENTQDFEGFKSERWVSLTKSSQPGQWGSQPTHLMSEDQKLITDDGEAGDRFGRSVGISGDYAIAGAYDDDSDQGSAYIFRRDENNWIQQTKIVASDGAVSDHFGISVSISGNYAVVGAYYDNNQQGSAYIFQRNGNNWFQQAKISAIDGTSNDRFGRSVSISGDYVIVGAYQDDNEQGSAYIFHRNGNSWTQQAKISAADGANSDNFGISVSITGDYAIVGAELDDIGNYTDTGSAYIFRRTGSTWSQQAKLDIPNFVYNYSYFGSSVSISDEYAVVGAKAYDDEGSAFIFHRSGNSWDFEYEISARDIEEDDLFGSAVCISGNYVVVGAYKHHLDNSNDQGTAYIFHRLGSTWSQLTKIKANDGRVTDRFGISVGISEDNIIVGAYQADIGNINQGAVYMYSKK